MPPGSKTKRVLQLVSRRRKRITTRPRRIVLSFPSSRMRSQTVMIASSRLPEGHSEEFSRHDIPREGRGVGCRVVQMVGGRGAKFAEVVAKAISRWARLRFRMRLARFSYLIGDPVQSGGYLQLTVSTKTRAPRTVQTTLRSRQPGRGGAIFPLVVSQSPDILNSQTSQSTASAVDTPRSSYRSAAYACRRTAAPHPW